MSCVNYANIQTDISNVVTQNSVNRPKPVLVRATRQPLTDWASRRVAEVVALELAHGSMPA